MGQHHDVFDPVNVDNGAWGVSEGICDGKGSGAAGVGLPFASKTAMVIGGNSGVRYVGTHRMYVPEGMYMKS